MLGLRKLYARHGRYDDIINMKFGFQSNKRMPNQVMKLEVCEIITRKEKPLDLNIGDNWRLTLLCVIYVCNFVV